jgi:S-adenosylmethionine-diacylglycerol 3-amino-3-carboxypropyl transferase
MEDIMNKIENISADKDLANNTIHYSQCWEDPETLLEALEVNSDDDVLSIGSGGDNSFALLLKKPRSITVVDSNAAQLYLIDLKIKAIQHFTYNEFIGFLGVTECSHRIELYNRIRTLLSPDTMKYWDKKSEYIFTGVIHTGKFDKFFSLFRKRVLPLIHRQDTVLKFLSCNNIKDQKDFYQNVWCNRRWRFLLRVFFSKFVMGHLGRDPSFYEHVNRSTTSDQILQRTNHGLSEVDISTNFFAEFILSGKYSNSSNMPPYLLESNFDYLKKHCDKIKLIQGTVTEYISSLKPGAVSKFNLSDIFEYMSQRQFENVLGNIAGVSRVGSRIAFWTLFINKTIPDKFRGKFRSEDDLSKYLYYQSRTFFYGSFNVWKIN